MPNLRDIRKRIGSVQNTKQITRTMEMVASAKIRHSFDRITAAQPYATCMAQTLAQVAAHTSATEHPLLRKHDDVKNVVIIAITSDRGLAGGFNSNVLREFEHVMQARAAQGAAVSVIACGKKAIAYFKYRKIEPLLSFAGLSADPTFDEAKQIASFAISHFESQEADEVLIIYNHAVNTANQRLVTATLLPIDTSGDASATSAADAKDGDAKVASSDSKDEGAQEGDYEFEPSAEEVLGRLLPANVETMVFNALIDSAAGEQGARRKAMSAATDSATEMLNSLNRVYNRVRQGAITTELNEIVGGAAALEE